MTNNSRGDLEAQQAGFGGSIRHLRLKAGLSQEELAERSGLDRTYVGGIERSERNPSLKNILRLAAALNVLPSALFDYVAATTLLERSRHE